jgi:hypothetical protein
MNPAPPFLNLRLVVLPVLLALASCGDNQSDGVSRNSTKAESSKASSRSEQSPEGAQSSRLRKNNASDPVDPLGSLAGLADDKILAICAEILARETISPESNSADRIEDALCELIRRRSPETAEMINSLPPGSNSEALLKQVFRKSDLRSLDEIFWLTGKIDDPEVEQKALDNAVSRYLERAKQDGMGGGTEDIKRLKEGGVSKIYIADAVCLGVSTASLPLAEVAEYLDVQDKEIMERVVQKLPYEISKEILRSGLKEGKKIDPVSLAMFSRSYSSGTPQEAVAWAQTLPKGADIIALKSSFSAWMEADPMKAGSYLSEMPEGPLKDQGILILVSDSLKHKSLDHVSQWISEIKDPALKAKAAEQVRAQSVQAK